MTPPGESTAVRSHSDSRPPTTSGGDAAIACNVNNREEEQPEERCVCVYVIVQRLHWVSHLAFARFHCLRLTDTQSCIQPISVFHLSKHLVLKLVF